MHKARLRKRIAPVSLALLGGAGLLWVRQAQPQSCVVQDGCDAGYFYRLKAGFEPAPARRLDADGMADIAAFGIAGVTVARTFLFA